MTYDEEIRCNQFTDDMIGVCVMLLDMKKKPIEIKDLINKYFGVDSFEQLNAYIEAAKRYIENRWSNILLSASTKFYKYGILVSLIKCQIC